MELMGKLKLEDQGNPSLSGYYGVILANAGKKAEARKYLDAALASKTKYLPEEIELFTRAKAAN